MSTAVTQILPTRIPAYGFDLTQLQVEVEALEKAEEEAQEDSDCPRCKAGDHHVDHTQNTEVESIRKEQF